MREFLLISLFIPASIFAQTSTLPQNLKIIENTCAGITTNCEGKITWSDGSSYLGSMFNGSRHGFGKQHFEDGIVFDGEWKYDKIGDQGAMIFPNGDEYLGTFVNEEINGIGTILYKDGTSYSGEWRYGMPNGKGYLIRSDKSKFVGTFQNGLRVGDGMLVWESADTLRGTWKAGNLDGKATFAFQNNDQLESFWKAGNLNTKGIYSFKDGKTFKGTMKQIRSEACNDIKSVMQTESNFQMAWLGFALEFKVSGDFELACDFLHSAEQFASMDNSVISVIREEFAQILELQKMKGLARTNDEQTNDE